MAVFICDCAARMRRVLVACLLAPVSILMGWGPITHIYINKRALERIDPGEAGDDGVREILADSALREEFVNAGNSTDLIKAIDLRNGEKLFEYAHNNIPNYFTGDPSMGRYLLEEIRRSGDDPVKRAWGYGWLAHQVSDGFAHKMPFAGCEGWANSRRIFAGHYRPVDEGEPVGVTNDRIRLYMADHLLAEMLIDCLCYLREREYLDSMNIDLSIPTSDEVMMASTRILKGFLMDLGTGIVYFEPLTESKLESISDYYHLLILCTFDMYRAVLDVYKGDEFEEYIGASNRMTGLDGLLEVSIDAVAYMFRHPENPWEARRWMPGESDNFGHSMYDYDGIWRPEMYNFVRKKGDRGPMPVKRAVDWFIRKSRDYAEGHDIWPLMRIGLGLMNGWGRNEWSVVSAFIRILIDRKPSSIQETTGLVTGRFRMQEYEEIVPD